MTRKVKRTRNGGTWTESQYWSAVRSALRQKFRYWKPAAIAKAKSRRRYTGRNKRRKWEYQCNHCKQYFQEKEINLDHVSAVGSLKRPEDLIGFLERLTPENEDSFQVLCKECHQEKTNNERKNK